jgi:hypothetical protein
VGAQAPAHPHAPAAVAAAIPPAHADILNGECRKEFFIGLQNQKSLETVQYTYHSALFKVCTTLMLPIFKFIVANRQCVTIVGTY